MMHLFFFFRCRTTFSITIMEVIEYLYVVAFQPIALNVFKGKGFILEKNQLFVNISNVDGTNNLGSNLNSQN